MDYFGVKEKTTIEIKIFVATICGAVAEVTQLHEGSTLPIRENKDVCAFQIAVNEFARMHMCQCLADLLTPS